VRQNAGVLNADDEKYFAITGNNDFVVFGGNIHNSDLFYTDAAATEASVITRMDLA